MSSAPEAQIAKGDSFRAGAELRAARERLGWELGEVAAALRIKLAYLQAIEDGRIAALPGNAYALGFLRTYATTLGLDADDIARRFRAEAQDVNRRPVLSFPAPVPERGVPTTAMILLGLVVASVAYVGWLQITDRQQVTARAVPAVPDQLLGATKTPPLSPQVASVMPRPGTAVPSPLPPTPTPTTPSTATPTPTATTASQATPPANPSALAGTPVTPATPATPAAPTTTAASTTTPSTPSAEPATPPAATQPAAPTTPAAHLALLATGITWVQVRASDGHVVWDHIMQPGDHWDVPADQSGLTLTTGNAGGLEIATDGKPSDVLGRVGAVRRNIPLNDAAAPAAQPAAQPAAASTPAATSPTAAVTEPPAAPPHPRSHPKPATPAPSSADDLNARQLEKIQPPSH